MVSDYIPKIFRDRFESKKYLFNNKKTYFRLKNQKSLKYEKKTLKIYKMVNNPLKTKISKKLAEIPLIPS